MRPIAWIWLAVSSLLIAAHADTRPQYGGTLHVTMHAAPLSLDPADHSSPDSPARSSLTALLFDTLVIIDDSGHVRPALAESWQATHANQRWQFRLHRGVKFHDGTPFDAESAAASLRFANSSWNVTVEGDSIVIDLDVADPQFLGELALPRNAIVKRESDNTISGTGPFHIADWQPARKLTLAANDDYWRGRPFVDGIEIDMDKSFRDQITALELGKADLVEVAPEQTHRILQEGHRLVSSVPLELLALVFAHDVSSPEEKALRQALALSVDRTSIRSVLLQGSGQPTASLLPTWMSGYGFVFSSDADLPKARELRSQSRTAPAWTIAYDNNEPLQRLLAERIALNAKDAGLSIQPTSSTSADLRLIMIPLTTSDPWIALDEILTQSGIPVSKSKSGSVEDLYAAEQAALATERVIPLFHLPVSYAAATKLRNWTLRLDGSWDMTDAWLDITRP
jgi:peptide/nickel transport system substrate-binding protein